MENIRPLDEPSDDPPSPASSDATTEPANEAEVPVDDALFKSGSPDGDPNQRKRASEDEKISSTPTPHKRSPNLFDWRANGQTSRTAPQDGQGEASGSTAQGQDIGSTRRSTRYCSTPLRIAPHPSLTAIDSSSLLTDQAIMICRMGALPRREGSWRQELGESPPKKIDFSAPSSGGSGNGDSKDEGPSHLSRPAEPRAPINPSASRPRKPVVILTETFISPSVLQRVQETNEPNHRAAVALEEGPRTRSNRDRNTEQTSGSWTTPIGFLPLSSPSPFYSTSDNKRKMKSDNSEEDHRPAKRDKRLSHSGPSSTPPILFNSSWSGEIGTQARVTSTAANTTFDRESRQQRRLGVSSPTVWDTEGDRRAESPSLRTTACVCQLVMVHHLVASGKRNQNDLEEPHYPSITGERSSQCPDPSEVQRYKRRRTQGQTREASRSLDRSYPPVQSTPPDPEPGSSSGPRLRTRLPAPMGASRFDDAERDKDFLNRWTNEAHVSQPNRRSTGGKRVEQYPSAPEPSGPSGSKSSRSRKQKQSKEVAYPLDYFQPPVHFAPPPGPEPVIGGAYISSTADDSWNLEGHTSTSARPQRKKPRVRGAIYSEKPRFECPSCAATFVGLYELNRHREIHAGITYQCPYCLREFHQKYGMDRHVRSQCCRKHNRR
ncbi:hypothetical protein C8F04DRAFT_226817 [Mycena alexandri]|uniref:C2H2-type domain-containing protein n=1 Tax=Mycena alexandri TaxID=1745969 RepID=A0AAD6T6J5_9AGAR|nr:hypothetical protein C8F04DRAFT_226817 [Mycena alexandri]